MSEMLTRDQVIENATKVIGTVSDKASVRDVMLRGRQASLTIVDAPSDAEEMLTTVLQEALQAIGVEETHFRFRSANAEPSGAAGEPVHASQGAGVSSASKESGGKVEGHSAGINSALLDPNSPVQFIAIASGKGGVGKSTVTVNLAVALARLGKRVGIIDADIYGFSVPDMLGIEEHPIIEDGLIQPIERFGVKTISMGFFVEDNSPIIWRGPMLGRMLRNFFQEVAWGELDYVLLDLPPGTGDVALDVHQMIPQSKEIIVTTPHATAAFVAARAGAMAKQTDHEIIGVVENMSYYVSESTGTIEYVFGRGGGARLAENLHVDLLAQIPLGAPDNHILEPDFSPSVYKEGTETGKLYLELAEKVINKLS